MTALHLFPELEDALRRIPGVRKARVVTDGEGRPTEIHLITDTRKSQQYFVRDVQAVATAEFAADDELQRQLFRRRVGTNDTRDGAFVGEREPRVTELGRGAHELLRVRGAAQEREVAEAVQLRVSDVGQA